MAASAPELPDDVWAGGFHGFDALFPDAAISVAARTTRTAWLARTLGTGRS